MILKKKKINIKKHLNIYKNNSIFQKKFYFETKFFSLFLRKKLQYYNYEDNNKIFSISNGYILCVITSRFKFFKKNRKSIGISIMLLKKKLYDKLKYIKYFFCKNFNYKQYLWLKKYFDVIKPYIKYFIVTKGWLYVNKKKKRLKKKVWRNLIINHKLL